MQAKRLRSGHPLYDMLPIEIEGFETLAGLALDMRWSWSHEADAVWEALDAALWESTRNPWVVLQTVSGDRIEELMADSSFRARVNALAEAQERAATTPAWFQQAHPGAPLTCVAYFSMEFMLSEALPIYSGGLGNVAGDQLKAASELGVPVVGVGLLYQQGYFRQVIASDGAQQALFPYNDPGQLPITPLREPNGEWVRVPVELSGTEAWLRGWQVQVGRARLYLLDSNDAANLPAHRGITSELYGGGPNLRIQQEIALGIGGWRLLRALGLQPEVCHLNEGHAAFAVLERARDFMQVTGQPFDVALAVTRAGNVFTTHTAVDAGFDRFEPVTVRQYLGSYARDQLGVTMDRVLGLGRAEAGDTSEPFNMAYLAVHGSGSVNGVSQLHAEVSRRLFRPLFPRWPDVEVPVGAVTNGVHTPSWESSAADELWKGACGAERWLGTQDRAEQIGQVPDSAIWRMRNRESRDLVEFTRRRLAQQLAGSGAAPGDVEAAKHLLDPNALTLGFARRFAAYKRPNLLLSDPERLLRILANPERRVQLILAGKAHPADAAGQAMIQEWIRFIRRPDVRPHAVFLSDYDMLLTEQLVHGVDVWLNTPRRPWEACGTSGMKVLANGGLNCSERDGWWAEACSPEVGWGLGDRTEHGDDPNWDATEASALYDLLEYEVIPAFYERNSDGIPVEWVRRIRNSMERLTPHFSANRAVREYTDGYYIPAATGYVGRSANAAAVGRQISQWREALTGKWGGVRIGGVQVYTGSAEYVFEARIELNGIEPSSVRVELYAEGMGEVQAVRETMSAVQAPEAVRNSVLYRVAIPKLRPASDFTVRVIPYFEGVAVPLEETHICWQQR